MASDVDAKGLVGQYFRVYESRHENADGLEADMFFVMVDEATFDDRFEALEKQVRELDPDLTLVYRREGGEDVLYLFRRPPPKPIRTGLHITLFLLTLLTTTLAGTVLAAGYRNGGQAGTLWTVGNVTSGILWFAVPLMLILGIHESAHFLAARRHGLRATFPYFLPLPPIGLLPIGTLGAFISLRDPLPDRKALFDVGASGPLAGFAVAIPVVVVGALMTQAGAVGIPDLGTPEFPDSTDYEVVLEDRDTAILTFVGSNTTVAFSVIAPDVQDTWTYTGTLVLDGEGTKTETFTGKVEPGQVDRRTVTIPSGMEAKLTIEWDDGLISFGDPLLLVALDAWLGDDEHLSHPLFIAGWVGLLLTGINLLPAGQLDGGHVARAILGDRMRYAAYGAMALLLWLGLRFDAWILMAAFVLLMGVNHPPPLNDRTQLDPKRRVWAGITIAVLVLTFVPVPIHF